VHREFKRANASRHSVALDNRPFGHATSIFIKLISLKFLALQRSRVFLA
jgi:hypothetical protein